MGSFLSDVIKDIVPHWLCILFFGGSFKPLGLTGKKNIKSYLFLNLLFSLNF